MGLLDDKLSPRERIEVINAVRGKLPIDYSTEMTIIPVEFEEQSSRIPVILPEREAINSFFEDFYMKRGTCQIWYRTTAEWDSDPTLIARKDIIYVYIDADSYVDPETGKTVYVPAIKLGDDVSYLIDLPLMSASTSSVVIQHIEDTYIHFLPGEKDEFIAALDSKASKADLNDVVEINAPTGTFNEATLNSLLNNRIKPIQYNGKLFTYTVRQDNKYRYLTTSEDPNEVQYVEVNIETGTWEYKVNSNQVLEDHIQDQVRHITANERTFWNSKLNCIDTVSEERFILNRN